ncbi:hypothetical protein LOTGIDRAFT_233100 [Lottia gigantea]|uniref:DUF4874 domain-containing protein n=1 Tax=Lottia gigantea TaxID=225164 RepID=V3ZMR5_LOTGI|nr:hypothetical protein LOTGIDRAFT_233100 [Lottia gigantea]ESO92668.1 hypothetical protein LOTGIDRAFT_233100 [Lottia gigantea]
MYDTKGGSKLLILIGLLCVGKVLAGCPTCPSISSVPNGFTKHTYTSTNEHIENPGRGFMQQSTGSSSHYSSLSQSHAPYGDANKYWVLEHIKQLKPIFQQYEGVITAVQAGFIGTWGEWYYTTYFGDPHKRDHHKYPIHGYSSSIFNDRKEVLLAVLNAVPKSIQVQIRYPAIKTSMFDYNPTTYGEVLQQTNKARTCHHNDCFLSSDNDVGTYSDKAKEYPYLHKDSEYCIVGGETCRPTSGPSGHYYAAELSKYHDTRTWHPGHTTLDGSVHVVRNFPAGSYDTYLAIGDKLLHDKSDFYVLMANQNVPV